MGPGDAPDVERTFRHESGTAVATLARLLGDIHLAEEAVQEAFLVAVQRWPAAGVPPNPAGWIVTTAKRRAIDRLRRESSRDDRQAEAALLHHRDPPDPGEVGAVRDDRLRLVFTCCHPALAPAAQAVALAEVEGPAPALAAVDRLDLAGYRHLHATRADLLRRLGRDAEAGAAYAEAIARTDNAPERRFLERRRAEVDGTPGDPGRPRR